MTEWLICLGASLTILALWPLARKVQGSWIGPGGLLCGVWFFGTFLPLCFSAYFPAQPAAYLLILGFVVVGVLGSSLPILALGLPAVIDPVDTVGRIPKGETAPVTGGTAGSLTSDSLFAFPRLHRLFLLATVVGSATPIVLYRAAVGMFGTSSLLELAARVTVARYSGDFTQGLSGSLLTMCLFFAALLGGHLTGLQTTHRRVPVIYLAWLLPLLACSVIQTTKASVLFGAGMFGTGLVLGMTQSGKAFRVRFSRLFLSVCGLCLLAFLFVFGGLLLRYSAFNPDSFDNSLPKATVYFVGHMGVLGDWVQRGGMDHPECGTGDLTFAGLFQFVGAHDREQGLFTDMVEFSNGITSNIYTAFRAAIEDFTLPGALLFFLLLSFLGGIGWTGLLHGHNRAAPLFMAFLAYVFFSPITSVFVYNTNVGALVLFALLLLSSQSRNTVSSQSIHRVLRLPIPSALS